MYTDWTKKQKVFVWRIINLTVFCPKMQFIAYYYTFSHLSIHFAWKSCEHGSRLNFSRLIYSLIQTTHLIFVSLAVFVLNRNEGIRSISMINKMKRIQIMKHSLLLLITFKRENQIRQIDLFTEVIKNKYSKHFCHYFACSVLTFQTKTELSRNDHFSRSA